MCRNIRTLFNFEPPATEQEIRASALQFVRKLSGFPQPSHANEAAFDRAVDEVVDAARQKNRDRVYFGATVIYSNARDEEKKVRIVGIDEARSEQNEVSWISPVAKALLKAGKGDIVEVRTPKGGERIEVLRITY